MPLDGEEPRRIRKLISFLYVEMYINNLHNVVSTRIHDGNASGKQYWNLKRDVIFGTYVHNEN